MDKTLSLYFLGIGGIGMSNLARYYLSRGKRVAGYDRTATLLTKQLSEEGADIHYVDNPDLIPDYCKDPATTMIIYTPALDQNNKEMDYFRKAGFSIHKRAQVLGEITRSSNSICVAGTHGKTTTSSMIAHLLKQSHLDCSAFLGGILKNYDTNLLLSESGDFTVIEADEYDRSFHSLSPSTAIITSISPDHLDIYKNENAYEESFAHFVTLIKKGGILLIKKGLNLTPSLNPGIRVYTYSGSEKVNTDFYACNIRINSGTILFDFHAPGYEITDVQLGVPVRINIENAVAAMAAALLNGATPEEVKQGIASFQGPKRRFDFHLQTDKEVLIDDYAHHPEELSESIKSVKLLYPDRKLTVVFQPHLYSRTRDFYKEFASALSLSDEVILLDIYPAREAPIEDVTSWLIYDLISISSKQLIRKEQLPEIIQSGNFEVVLMAGAGDIELLIPAVKQILENKC